MDLDKFIFYKRSIEIKYDDITQSYGMFATEFIPAETLIFIEQGLNGTEEYILSTLTSDPLYQSLIDQLYPRNGDLLTKLIHNRFGNKEEGTLYFTKSKVNHSCTPNTGSIGIAHYKKFIEAGYMLTFLATYQDIQPGEEITIMYSSKAGHGNDVFNWSCPCTKTEQEKNERNQYFRTNLLEPLNDAYWCIFWKLMKSALQGKPLRLTKLE